MSETISKASVCEILADIYPTDGEKVVAVKEVNKAYEAIQQLPPADVQLDTKELVAKIKKGISATNADDVYSCGMRDGMRWCMSLVDDEEPLFENCPSAQPEIIRCKDCGHWDTTWQNDFAPNYHYCSLVDGTRRGDFFCADAERRGEQDADTEV